MRSKRRDQEIKLIIWFTWIKHEIYKRRSRDVNDKRMRYTWREHDIMKKRAWDLYAEIIRSTQRDYETYMGEHEMYM